MDISMPVKNRRSFKKRSLSSKIIRYIVLIIFAIPMVLPLLWMLSTALKNNNSVFAIPPEWIPKEFQISNFATGLIQIDFWSRFSNTMIIAVLCVVGQILSSLSVGYAISRIRFPGRKLWFYLIIGSMMLPGMVSLIPVFHIYSSIGLYNTWWPLIIPAFLGNPFYTFLTRQFMSTIPYSYDEAAKMDGASHLQVLTKVLVPMCKPLIATMAVMAFQGAWND
ncbi:MAG TPA: ABC transporter permease, partial [Clostridiaceae bacterium]|nr:ABC transporter permease [Clostridiaceae bacterium]